MYIVQCRDGGVREYVGVERGKKSSTEEKTFFGGTFFCTLGMSII